MLESEIRGRIQWSSVRLFFLAAVQQRLTLVKGLLALTLASACWSFVSLLSGQLADRILAVARSGAPIHQDPRLAGYFTLIIAALYAMYLGNRYGRLYVNQTLIKALTALHEKALHAVLHSPLQFFNLTESGRIVSRFSNDFSNAAQSLDRTMATFLYSILAMFFCAVAILSTQPAVLIVAAPFALGIYLASRWFGRRARDYQRSASRASAFVQSHLNETTNSSVSFRALGLSERMISRMESLLDEAAHRSLASSEMSNHRALTQSLCALAVIVGAFVVCGRSYEQGHLSLGEVGAIVTLLMVILRNFVLVIELVNTIEVGFVSVERLNEFALLPSEESSHGRALGFTPQIPVAAKSHACESPSEASALAQPDLLIESLSVRYAKDTPRVLDQLSASIQGQRLIGLVGRSGAGKSTLVAALLRFVPIESGRIFLRGRDIAELPVREVRKRIALVSQDPILFSGTLLENVILGASLKNPEDRSRAAETLHLVGLGSWLDSLPEGLATHLLERGSNLSQGQRQLVCLARAMAQTPQLLVLDEATSAVDHETERLVASALNEIKKRISILLVAHRPETIARCDILWRVADGKIVEQSPDAQFPDQGELA